MNRRVFYKQIKNDLYNFSNDEIRKVLEYYDEIINDKMDLGYSEEEAIASLGDIRNITSGIKANAMYEMVSDKKQKSSSLKNFWIILGICSAPILIPLGIGFFIGFLAIIFSLIIVIVSISGAAIFSIAYMIVILIDIINTGASLSTILIISGGIVFATSLFVLILMGIVKLSTIILRAFVRLFSKKVKNKSKKESLRYA